MKLKYVTPWKKSYDQPRQHIQKQRHYFVSKGSSSQGYGFSGSHVWMWELDYKESWALKNWCFWSVVLEKTLESPLDCKEIQPVHSIEDQSWVFFGSTDANAEAPVLCPPHAKSWLIRKDSDAGRDEGQEEKGTTQDEMAEWHHWLNGHEFEWTPESRQWTERPGMLRFMGSQRIGHDWVTEPNWFIFRYPIWINESQNPSKAISNLILALLPISFGELSSIFFVFFCLPSFHIVCEAMNKFFFFLLIVSPWFSVIFLLLVCCLVYCYCIQPVP